MLKWVVLLCFVQALMAYPGLRTQDEIEELRSFLYKSKQEGEMTLEEAMAKNPKASAWENSGKYQGDIVLMDEEIDEMVAEYASNVTDSPINRNGLVNTNHRWPGQTVIYEIPPNTFSQWELSVIQSGINFFSDTTCTRWVHRTNQHDFVRFTRNSDGCYATVGYWQNSGAHTLNLANGCFNRQIVIHEMLHSAGFHHMHQSYNRYDWVWINWQNVGHGMQHNFNVFNNQIVTMLGLPYEYASNQHYDQFAFSFNGQPTIGARYNTNGQMGQITHITGWDIWRLARLYNCPGAWSVEIRPEDINKPYDESFGRRLKEAADREMRAQKTMDKEETLNEENQEGQLI